MKRNGFTLVELLASLTILGILMVITVPNVVGILTQNREKTYNEDARKMISTAKYKMIGNNGIVKPGISGGKSQCIVMSLGYLDNSEYENPPNGGMYSRAESYVIVKRVASKYEFYARLVEDLDAKDGATSTGNNLFGVDATIENELEKGVEAGKVSSINLNVNMESINKSYFESKFNCQVIANYYNTKIYEDFCYDKAGKMTTNCCKKEDGTVEACT